MALLGGGACASGADTSKGQLLIYASLPLTGDSLDQTQAIVNAMNLALEQYGGTAGGYKIRFQALNDASEATGTWTAEQESLNAEKAVADKATVYLGTYNSGAAAIAIPILNEAGIPMVSPANTAPELTKKGFDDRLLDSLYTRGDRNFFRVIPADDLQGPAGANWAKELGAENVYVLHDDEVYGLGVATAFQNKAKDLGLTIRGFKGIDPTAVDYTTLIQEVKSSGADLLYFGGRTQTNGGELLKDLRDAVEHVTWIGPDGVLENAFIDAAGEEAAEGAYATFVGGPYHHLQGKGATFYQAYKARYNSEPEAYAIFGYDAMLAALSAIDKACSKDPTAVLNALRNLGEVDGALGKWSFDQNGDTTISTMNLYRVQGGVWRWVRTITSDHLSRDGGLYRGGEIPAGSCPAAKSSRRAD